MQRASRASRFPAFAALAAWLAGFPLHACNGLQDLQLQGACVLNSDCTAPLVCAFQVCHEQCVSSSDCPMPEICVRGGGDETTGDGGPRPFFVCESVACSVDADCPSGQTCAPDHQCRDTCSSGMACVTGQTCVDSVCVDKGDSGKAAWKVDAGAGGMSCVLNSDCGDAGLVCRNGICDVQCNATIDCVAPFGPGGSCVDHICVVPNLGDASGIGRRDGATDAAHHDARRDASQPDSATDGPPALGKPCTLPSDCPGALRCSATGTCAYQCDLAEDCANGGLGYCCVAHTCYSGASCSVDSGADGQAVDASADAKCTACASNDDCQNGDWCDGVEECYAGCCAAALDTPCDSHSPCIIDTCDAANMTCTHTTVAGYDADGDGHLAFGCVGGDDCNDEDPTVYTGHPEVYDGKDNDCNGYIDDWVAQPKGMTQSFGQVSGLTSGYPYAVPIGGAAGDPANGAWGFVQLYNTSSVSYYARQLYETGWTAEAQASPVPDMLPSAPYSYFDAASGPTSAAFLAYEDDDALIAVVTNNDLSLAGEATLNAPGQGGVYYASITWTGNDYIAGWNVDGLGYVAQISATGGFEGAQAVPTEGGAVFSDTAVSVASNGSALAVAYTGPGPSFGVLLTVLSPTGAFGGTVQCAPGSAPYSGDYALAVAGVPQGFVVLWTTGNNTNATFVPTVGGVADASHLYQMVADPDGHGYVLAQGAFDGVGAAFLLSNNSEIAFGYLNGEQKTAAGNPANPFELTVVGPGANNVVDLAGAADGRLAAAYNYGGDLQSLYATQVGYCSLSGSACSVASNCCSGTCTPVVVGGPKAYSLCQ